eukprot:m.107272 g.107272  ORF g.107272 m.107272 type:complete len:327 (-) comp9212_c0_seq5:267-1247(-)
MAPVTTAFAMPEGHDDSSTDDTPAEAPGLWDSERAAWVIKYTCPIDSCHRTYVSARGLGHHMYGHSAKPKDERGRPRYDCPLPGCARQFSSSAGLGNHVQRHDGRTKHLPCPEPGCSKRFTTPEGLRLHRSRIHEDHASSPGSDISQSTVRRGRRRTSMPSVEAAPSNIVSHTPIPQAGAVHPFPTATQGSWMLPIGMTPPGFMLGGLPTAGQMSVPGLPPFGSQPPGTLASTTMAALMGTSPALVPVCAAATTISAANPNFPLNLSMLPLPPFLSSGSLQGLAGAPAGSLGALPGASATTSNTAATVSFGTLAPATTASTLVSSP